MNRNVTIIVRGVVRGVGFRIYAQQEARRLGLRGYVRNRVDGSVEIVSEGNAAAIDRLIAWARHGPPAAEVEDVEVTEGEPSDAFIDFTVRH
jgi:acylphosphatase